MRRRATRVLVATAAAAIGLVGLTAVPASAVVDPGPVCTLPVRDSPKHGDAVLYDWDHQGGGSNGWGIDHVGIVESYKNGVLTTIEGNTAPSSGMQEGVYRRTRSLTDVVGFVTPT